jgi:Cu(I)/Ag(I) efflux system protein CusF
MPASKKPETGAQSAHKATATVKKLNEKTGVVTLAHGPVPTLNWPAMTMGFKVKDKELLPKLAEGKKVDVEFRKEGDDYVVTRVR